MSKKHKHFPPLFAPAGKRDWQTGRKLGKKALKKEAEALKQQEKKRAKYTKTHHAIQPAAGPYKRC